MPLPTNRTTSDTIEEHIDDHNALNTQHNELEGHAADTTSVHGIADTAALALSGHDHDADYEPIGAAATAVAAVIDAAPGTLDTLNELAAALGDDANYASTVTTALAGKASTSHHTSHEPGGGDALTADAAAGTASLRTLGTGATQAAAGNDARLSDTRTPTDGSVTNAKVDVAAAIAETKLSLASDAAAGTASRRSLGTGATQAAAGNHAHSGTYEPSGTVATHAAAADPHAGYVLESLIDAAGDLIVGTAADTVGRLAKGSALQVLRVNSGATALEYADASGGGGSGIFGDGSDGVVNFDGSTTVLGLAPSSSIYTLNRDIFLATGSQVSGTAVIITAGYRIHCSGTFTVGASATVQRNGANASGATAGAALSGGPLGGSVAGAAGGTGVGARPGTTVNTLGGDPGAGGNGTSGSGGALRPASPPTAAVGGYRAVPQVTLGYVFTGSATSQILGGQGGSSGAGDGTNSGGGGGSGGGVVIIIAKGIVNSGTIAARGGAGGNGTGGNTGGGGGGGGGVVFLTYNTFSGTAASVTGGTKGLKVGTGTDGGDGSAGTVITVSNA